MANTSTKSSTTKKAGRPAKTTAPKTTKAVKEEVIEEKSIVEESKAEPVKSEVDVAALLQEIELLKKAVASQPVAQVQEEEKKIGHDDLVPVVSHFVGGLALSADGKGGNPIYYFSQFNEVQDIPFGDLRDIVRNNASFAQGGYFYILDTEAVKQLRLEGYYQRQLTHDEMVHLFNNNPEQIIELYKMAPEAEKELILDLIEDKKQRGENVDGNVLVTLGELSGRNLVGIEQLDKLK